MFLTIHPPSNTKNVCFVRHITTFNIKNVFLAIHPPFNTKNTCFLRYISPSNSKNVWFFTIPPPPPPPSIPRIYVSYIYPSIPRKSVSYDTPPSIPRTSGFIVSHLHNDMYLLFNRNLRLLNLRLELVEFAHYESSLSSLSLLLTLSSLSLYFLQYTSSFDNKNVSYDTQPSIPKMRVSYNIQPPSDIE